MTVSGAAAQGASLGALRERLAEVGEAVHHRVHAEREALRETPPPAPEGTGASVDVVA